jgi:CHASE1-domain containing sensor protein
VSEDREEITTTKEPNKIVLLLRQALITVGLMFVAFLIGICLMGLKWWGAASDRDAAQKQLRLSQLQNNLASAAVDAGRGDYEPARQAASNFFTSATNELENTGSNIFTKEQQTQLKTLLSSRDQIITLLSRNDPAATEKLKEMYVLYRKVMNNEKLEMQGPPKPPTTNASPAMAASPAPSS